MANAERKFLLVTAGNVSEPVRARIGSYAERFRAMMGLGEGEAPEVRIHRGECLPAPDAAKAVVVSGSPAMITERLPWAEAAANWLRAAVERGIPVFGICFGHQLLAHACGGAVARMPGGPEFGSYELVRTPESDPDPLFGRLPRRFYAQESHFEAVASLPRGAICLARSPSDPHHAFRVGACAWGVQFHPERDAEAARIVLRSRSDVLRQAGLEPDAALAGVRESTEAASLVRAFRDWVERNRG